MGWSSIQHFDRHEFGDGDPGVEPDWKLVQLLDKARNMAGIPFKITSGLRTAGHNRKIGGSPKSAHVTGHAVDIMVPGSAWRWTIVTALIAAGFKRIGIYDGHIHADVSPDLPQRVMWTGKSK